VTVSIHNLSFSNSKPYLENSSGLDVVEERFREGSASPNAEPNIYAKF
jgi:hypothetical protein